MKLITLTLAAILLTGCATRGANYVPVVDTQYRDVSRLAIDTSECQQFSNQRADAATGAVVGVLFGALLGAALMPRGYESYGARQGAIAGGVGGAYQANETQETIIKRCLSGRGYSVLN